MTVIKETRHRARVWAFALLNFLTKTAAHLMNQFQSIPFKKSNLRSDLTYGKNKINTSIIYHSFTPYWTGKIAKHSDRSSFDPHVLPETAATFWF